MSEVGARWALVITRNFPPLVGGMERLNQHLVHELSPDWLPALCGPAGCRAFVGGDVPVAENAIRPLAIFLARSLIAALIFAIRLRPEHVIGGSGLVAPLVWIAARAVRADAVLYLHGLDLVAPSRVYQALWLPFIRAANLVLVNSANTRRLAIERGVRADRLVVLHPGTSVPAPMSGARDAFRERHGCGDRPLLLSVGRFTRRKGLAEFIVASLPAIGLAQPGVLLLIVGEEATDALHGSGGGERDRILAAAASAGVASQVLFLGRCSEDELQLAYHAADCHVFPVLDLPGDVEGFGMVALEAAAHGLLTVAFAVGGVPDAVVDGQTGRLVRPGDYRAFADATISLLASRGNEHAPAACRAFAAEKAWPEFGRRLRASLARLCD